MMRYAASRMFALACGFGLACFCFVGCDDSPAAECHALPTVCPATVPSYATQIAPIFNARCNGCHNANDPTGPWPFDSHSDVDDWSGMILDDLEHCTMPPPDSGMPLPDNERALLQAWLACGAPNN